MPVIQWYRKETSVSAMDSSKYAVHADGTLQINNVSLSDGGIYRCEASNEGGLDSLSITADVHCELYDVGIFCRLSL